MTEMEKNGGLAEVIIEQVNTERASVLIGEEKLMDILFNEDEIIAIHKIRHENKWVCVDAWDLLTKLMIILEE